MPQTEKDKILRQIAYEHLRIHTLDTRKGDSLDFSEQAVWSIKAALEAAYKAGQESIADTRFNKGN